jgi:hypothetical protein
MQLHNHTNIRLHSHLRAQWRFQLFNKRAVLLARHLLPFLKVKHEQARLFTTFPIDSRIEPGVKIDRREINRIRSTIRDQVAALNHGPILRAA